MSDITPPKSPNDYSNRIESYKGQPVGTFSTYKPSVAPSRPIEKLTRVGSEVSGIEERRKMQMHAELGKKAEEAGFELEDGNFVLREGYEIASQEQTENNLKLELENKMLRDLISVSARFEVVKLKLSDLYTKDLNQQTKTELLSESDEVEKEIEKIKTLLSGLPVPEISDKVKNLEDRIEKIQKELKTKTEAGAEQNIVDVEQAVPKKLEEPKEGGEAAIDKYEEKHTELSARIREAITLFENKRVKISDESYKKLITSEEVDLYKLLEKYKAEKDENKSELLIKIEALLNSYEHHISQIDLDTKSKTNNEKAEPSTFKTENGVPKRFDVGQIFLLPADHTSPEAHWGVFDINVRDKKLKLEQLDGERKGRIEEFDFRLLKEFLAELEIKNLRNGWKKDKEARDLLKTEVPFESEKSIELPDTTPILKTEYTPKKLEDLPEKLSVRETFLVQDNDGYLVNWEITKIGNRGDIFFKQTSGKNVGLESYINEPDFRRRIRNASNEIERRRQNKLDKQNRKAEKTKFIVDEDDHARDESNRLANTMTEEEKHYKERASVVKQLDKDGKGLTSRTGPVATPPEPKEPEAPVAPTTPQVNEQLNQLMSKDSSWDILETHATDILLEKDGLFYLKKPHGKNERLPNQNVWWSEHKNFRNTFNAYLSFINSGNKEKKVALCKDLINLKDEVLDLYNSGDIGKATSKRYALADMLVYLNKNWTAIEKKSLKVETISERRENKASSASEALRSSISKDKTPEELKEWRKTEENETQRIKRINDEWERTSAEKAGRRVMRRDPGLAGSMPRLIPATKLTDDELRDFELEKINNGRDTLIASRKVYSPLHDNIKYVDKRTEEEKLARPTPIPESVLSQSPYTGGMVNPADKKDGSMAHYNLEKGANTTEKKKGAVGKLMQSFEKRFAKDWRKYALAVSIGVSGAGTLGYITHKQNNNPQVASTSPKQENIKQVENTKTEKIETTSVSISPNVANTEVSEKEGAVEDAKKWTDYQTQKDREFTNHIVFENPAIMVSKLIPEVVNFISPSELEKFLDVDAYKIMNEQGKVYGLSEKQRESASAFIKNLESVAQNTMAPMREKLFKAGVYYPPTDFEHVPKNTTIKQYIEKIKTAIIEANERDKIT